MRNLAQHPITNEEIVETLEKMRKDIEALELYGDIRPLVLRSVTRIVKLHRLTICIEPPKA